MKKILIVSTILISCLGISSVKADSVEFDYGYSYLGNSITNFDEFSSYLNKHESKVSELYRLLFEKYNSEYVNDYPYYLLQFTSNSLEISMRLISFKSPIYLKTNGDAYGSTYYEDGSLLQNLDNTYINLIASYSFDDGMYILPVVNNSLSNPGHYGLQLGKFHETFFLDSNFDLKIYTDMNNIIVHNYRNTNTDYIINSGDIYPTLYKNGISSTSSYIEINLNNYSYVALALKDYNQKPFSTQIYVKGNYCLTPVYNYGMTERKDILTGSQVDRCSPYYDTYTPVRTSILENDLKNHAIYYLKSYDISKDNYIKVDTSVFDITYITEENKDKPYVTIDGKIYPTIPYDDLDDTSIKSEDEGYMSGAVEEFSFSDIFTAPLDFLKDIWGSIASVFDLVKEFFSLLPEPIPTFLLTSFMLAVVIGLLKIIL